ncbi:MAG: response regulator, partial [Chitinivibrionales bacterium]|nr:response regulator [Chitinivibrionales bacterium]MBD3356546.1 response regulator [Chitinivibrionales bacterium]
AQRDGTGLEITVSDDGGGIDIAAIKENVVRDGLVTPERAATLSENEFIKMAFRSGVSTRGEVTDISGRGLGLAIVGEGVEKLSGQIAARTSPRGTTFTIGLPSTVASLRGIHVATGGREFIVPTSFVERVMRLGTDSVKTVENRETIQTGDETIALMRLGVVLGLGPRSKLDGDREHVVVVIIQFAGRKLALTVDRVIDEREVVIKRLGPQLPRVRMIAGATIAAGGVIIPVLNIGDVMSGGETEPALTRTGIQTEEHGAGTGKTVLVVEDSITARTLLKNILESSGYKVGTAADGAEALALLRTENYDIVVSDIDMPRVNGTELTQRIREDARISEMPVILVSALESREDRERGIEAGANAYIVKSKFESRNLLETIHRLI